jgi:hydrogenase expression/formation protein HypC
MCLAIPGRVVEWLDRDALFARARVEFGGVSRNVNMQCVPEAAVDEFVLVHAGIAISKIDSDEAERILSSLEELNLGETEDNGDAP